MKKSTFIIGVISSFLLLVGVAMKFEHWPGASVLIILSVVLFAFGYSVLLMIDKNAFAQNSFQKTVNLMTMLSMSIIMIAFLFKATHWQYARYGLYAGHLLLLAMIPLLFMHASKESDPVKKLNFNNEAIMLVLLTAFSFFIWLVRSITL
jgi:hypothetical protein